MKDWISGCKRCGKELVKYSDRSYRNSLRYGFSRPEYCPECEEEQRAQREGLGVSYFSAETNEAKEIQSDLGSLEHPTRNHRPIEREVTLDQNKFGLTPKKVRELADWFSNPRHRVAIVVGPTGSGKSTLLPFWMMYPPEESGVDQDFFTHDGQIIHTQPRRMSAKGQTEFVGEKIMGGEIGPGLDVGYRYSQNDKSDWRNLWVPMTDGLFINEIIKGKIGGYGYVIIDEAHERSLNIDQILRLLKERLPLFPKLKVIVCSATINAEMFRDFFGSEVATIIQFEGKQRVDDSGKPIVYQVFYQGCNEEDKILPYDNLKKLGRVIVPAVVDKAMWLLKQVLVGEKVKGDILVFLNSVNSINEAIELTKSRFERDDLTEQAEVYRLYRDMPEDEKDKVRIHDLSDGKVRIIYSTNIAEASVTIDSLGYEVETGIENQSNFDSETATTSLPLTLIAKTNCIQRWGRTGRVRNGEVYCMYTEEQYQRLFLSFPISAINRSSMEELLLTMKTAGVVNPNDNWLETPVVEEMERSKQSLMKVGALTSEGNLSKKGLMLQNFSYTAELVESLLQADEQGCLVEMISVLPVIKNGGQRRILDWSFDWNPYEKEEAFVCQQALMSGCKDDIEFILKVIKQWDSWFWTERRGKGQVEEGVKQEQYNWARLNFIKVETMESIANDRNDLVKQFYDEAKDREIDLTLIPRVQRIINNLFPEAIYEPTEEYQYDFSIKPQDQSQVNCRCLRVVEPRDESVIDRLKFIPVRFISSEQLEAFRLLTESHKVRDTIKIKVVEVRIYPNDKAPVLVTEEVGTNCRILVDIQSLSFSKTAMALKSIPIGSIMEVDIENIDMEKCRVFVSTWRLIEQKLLRLMVLTPKETGKVVMAKVIDINVSNVQFLLDWSSPETGILLTIIVYDDKLTRPIDSFVIGEEGMFIVSRGKKPTRVPFGKISEEMEKRFEKGQKVFGLSYDGGSLVYEGSMLTESKLSLKALTDNPDFHQAVDKIHGLSNRLWVSRVVDMEWYKEVKEKFDDGTVIEAVVERIDDQNGMALMVNGHKAFMPRSMAIFRSNSLGLGVHYSVGDGIKVKIKDIKLESQQLIVQEVN